MAQDGDKKKNYSIPIGLKELLEDMSCYALRLQPKNENLHPFFADYLEMRLGLRERGEFYVRDFDSAKQGSPTGDSDKKAGGNNGGNKGKESVSSNSSSKGRLEKSGSGSQKSGGSGPHRSSSEPKNNVNEPQGQKDGTNTRQRLSLDTTIRKPRHTTARVHVDHVLDEALELLNTLDELDEDPMLSQLQGEFPDQTGAAAGQGRGIRARGRDPSISDLASEDRIFVREIQELKGQVNNLKNHLDDRMGRPHTALGQEPGHKGQAGTRTSISYTHPITRKRLRKSVSNPKGPVQAATGPSARQTQSLPQAGTSSQGIDPATGKPYGYINELAINPAAGKVIGDVKGGGIFLKITWEQVENACGIPLLDKVAVFWDELQMSFGELNFTNDPVERLTGKVRYYRVGSNSSTSVEVEVREVGTEVSCVRVTATVLIYGSDSTENKQKLSEDFVALLEDEMNTDFNAAIQAKIEQLKETAKHCRPERRQYFIDSANALEHANVVEQRELAIKIVREGKIGTSLIEVGKIFKKHHIRLIYFFIKLDADGKMPKNPEARIRTLPTSELTEFVRTEIIYKSANETWNHVEPCRIRQNLTEEARTRALNTLVRKAALNLDNSQNNRQHYVELLSTNTGPQQSFLAGTMVKQKGRRAAPDLSQGHELNRFNQSEQQSPVTSNTTRKGRRSVDPSDEPTRIISDLSDEFKRNLAIAKKIERTDESPIVLAQKDRVQKWREDSAEVSNVKIKLKHSNAVHRRVKKSPIKLKSHRGPINKPKLRQSMEFIRSALSESQPSEILAEPKSKPPPQVSSDLHIPQRSSRDLLRIARRAAADSPLVEPEPRKSVRLDTPNPMSIYQTIKPNNKETQREAKRSIYQEVSQKIRRDTALTSQFETRGTGQQSFQRTANARTPRKQSVDMLSATTFNMPSASQAWMSQDHVRDMDRQRAELIYYNNRDRVLKRDTSSVELSPTVENLRSSPRASQKIPESQEGPGTQTSSGQGHRRKQVQLQWDYSSLKVSNLSLDLKTTDLHDLFPDAMSVTKPVREVDPVSGDLVSYAFILFSSTDDAAHTLKKYQGRVISGQKLSLAYRQFSTVR